MTSGKKRLLAGALTALVAAVVSTTITIADANADAVTAPAQAPAPTAPVATAPAATAGRPESASAAISLGSGTDDGHCLVSWQVPAFDVFGNIVGFGRLDCPFMTKAMNLRIWLTFNGTIVPASLTYSVAEDGEPTLRNPIELLTYPLTCFPGDWRTHVSAQIRPEYGPPQSAEFDSDAMSTNCWSF